MDFVTNSAIGGSGDGILKKNALTTQLLRVMRLTAFILLVFALTVSAKSVSQNTVSYSGRNVPIGKVFNEIKKQTGYVVVTNKERFDRSEKIDVSADKMSITDFMQMILEGKPWDFEIRSKTIFIKEKPAAQQKTSELNAVRSPQGDVTGRVTNAQGEPLAGASVIVKRTGKGDIADANGNFKLKNVNADDVLEISFTGYKTLSTKVSGTVMQIALNVAVDELDRAVVQGYGKTTQRYSTGNIAKVTSEEIQRQAVMNPLFALQGKVPGLDVVQTNGFASSPVKIELRGRNVIGIGPNETFPSDPLYIIDGVPLTVLEVGGGSSYSGGSTGFLQSPGVFRGPAGGQSPFFNINPADIESIEVLKDADATAIYGSRGANGVILITTKKGSPGKTTFELNVNQGISKITRFWDALSTPQYLQMRREALANDGIVPSISHGDVDLVLWDTTAYTDWQRTLFGGTGKNTNVQTAVTGGNSQTNYRIGAGYNHATNIMTVAGADERASLSFNISNYSRDERFNISLSSIYSYTKSNMTNYPSEALILPPNAPPIYDSAGKLNYDGFGGSNQSVRNSFPFSGLEQPYVAKTNLLSSSLTLSFEPFKGLRFRTSAGYNVAQANQEQLNLISSYDPMANVKGTAIWGFSNNKNWIVEPQISYEKYIGRNRFSVLIGSTLQQNTTDGLAVAGTGYTSDDLITTISNAPIQSSSQMYGIYKYAAFFGRISYNYLNKYLLNINARRDGSSRFGEEKQYGNFGSIGGAWIFSEENWFVRNKNILSFGKLRASYGSTGTDALGDYKYLTRWSAYNTTPYGGVTTLLPTQHANPNFQWQVNKKLEGAIDLGFFNGNIHLSVVYYRNRCGNQLTQFPTPSMTGFASVVANSPALVQNDGWEFVFGSRLIDGKSFKWSMSFNTGINRNKLLAYPGLEQSPFAKTLTIGKALNVVQVFKYKGIDPATGEYTVEDLNKDGQITFDPGKVSSDTYAYDLTPKFIGGVNMNFSYKTIQLNLTFNVKKQNGRNPLMPLGRHPGSLSNQQDDILGRQWREEGDLATIPRFSTTTLNSASYFSGSDAIYSEASFVRLANLSLSYGLPEPLIKRIGIKGIGVFLHANNLFVLTRYKGIDPETLSFGSLPPVKNIATGLNFSF